MSKRRAQFLLYAFSFLSKKYSISFGRFIGARKALGLSVFYSCQPEFDSNRLSPHLEPMECASHSLQGSLVIVPSQLYPDLSESYLKLSEGQKLRHVYRRLLRKLVMLQAALASRPLLFKLVIYLRQCKPITPSRRGHASTSRYFTPRANSFFFKARSKVVGHNRLGHYTSRSRKVQSLSSCARPRLSLYGFGKRLVISNIYY